jgi:hypothetical protein
MKKKSEEARLCAALLPLAEKVTEVTRELHEWRREAGVKSTWGNHKKLKEGALFAQAEAACQALTDTLVCEFPDHWQLQDWVFKPARMGGEVRWAGKKGRARDNAITLDTSWVMLSSFIGCAIGVITKSQRIHDTDIQRMSVLGLSTTEMATYSFYNGQCFHETKGRHPRDAYSRLHMKGKFDLPRPNIKDGATHRGAMEFGISWAGHRIASLKEWSASPTLWAKLRKDPRVRNLAGTPPEYLFRVPPWRNYKGEEFDLVMAMGLALLDTLPKKPGTKKAFLVNRGDHWGAGAPGWCGTSAILGTMIKDIDAGKLPNDVDMWRAFALADECAGQARRIAEDFLPPAELVTT